MFWLVYDANPHVLEKCGFVLFVAGNRLRFRAAAAIPWKNSCSAAFFYVMVLDH